MQTEIKVREVSFLISEQYSRRGGVQGLPHPPQELQGAETPLKALGLCSQTKMCVCCLKGASLAEFSLPCDQELFGGSCKGGGTTCFW